MKLPFRFTKMIFTKGKISAWWQGRCAHIGSRSLGMVTVLRIIPMIIREWYRRILWEIWHRVLYIRLKVGHVLWRRNGRHVLAHAARGATLIHVIERLWTGWHTMGHVWRKILRQVLIHDTGWHTLLGNTCGCHRLIHTADLRRLTHSIWRHLLAHAVWGHLLTHVVQGHAWPCTTGWSWGSHATGGQWLPWTTRRHGLWHAARRHGLWHAAGRHGLCHAAGRHRLSHTTGWDRSCSWTRHHWTHAGRGSIGSHTAWHHIRSHAILSWYATVHLSWGLAHATWGDILSHSIWWHIWLVEVGAVIIEATSITVRWHSREVRSLWIWLSGIHVTTVIHVICKWVLAANTVPIHRWYHLICCWGWHVSPWWWHRHVISRGWHSHVISRSHVHVILRWHTHAILWWHSHGVAMPHAHIVLWRHSHVVSWMHACTHSSIGHARTHSSIGHAHVVSMRHPHSTCLHAHIAAWHAHVVLWHGHVPTLGHPHHVIVWHHVGIHHAWSHVVVIAHHPWVHHLIVTHSTHRAGWHHVVHHLSLWHHARHSHGPHVGVVTLVGYVARESLHTLIGIGITWWSKCILGTLRSSWKTQIYSFNIFHTSYSYLVCKNALISTSLHA